MLNQEPIIKVGIIERVPEMHGVFNGVYELPSTVRLRGPFSVRSEGGRLAIFDDEGIEVWRRREIVCRPLSGATFTIRNVTIGLHFHWERREDQTFEGDLRLVAHEGGTLTVINEVSVENYLKSVISSEMSAEAPEELLKAHAITSRSWLVAMLERQQRGKNLGTPRRSFESETEITRWYDREDHPLFDVCADDHCQRYQGITKILTSAASQAVDATRGVFLVHNEQVCDARFFKACGGLTENFENAWEDTPVDYLKSVSDSPADHPRVSSEVDARRWILSAPQAYCNTTDGDVLRQILPSFDQETTDFFRWKVEYTREQLEELLRAKSGIDFGVLMDLVPVVRGPSGRIIRLKIVGTRRTMTVGKELEIRKWLSKSHLYSSAFVADIERDRSGIPVRFILHGAGWGHGVGLCQIGAAVMANNGKKAEEIVTHYFRGAQLQKLY
ncbi:MAG: SpoIID/LytB domain-containing protein [Ignavibacteria bacterium]|nr:SpoIID/LytB domain-containing protein [Ignavibacteria bacterium]